MKLIGAGMLLVLVWLFPFYYVGGIDTGYSNVWEASFNPHGSLIW
jgi:hypothetical protein